MASVYQFPIPSFNSAFAKPTKLGNPLFSLKEISYRHSLSSIQATDGSQRSRSSNRRTPSGGEGMENTQSYDGRLSSSSKEEILALFRRIQASLAKGESSNSKNRNSKPSDEKPTAESLLEILRDPGTQKGKVSVHKPDKSLAPQNDSLKKEDITEPSSPTKEEDGTKLPSLTNSRTKAIRPPSSFNRKSPITSISSSSRDRFESEIESSEENSEQESKKLGDMKLAELKEVAKSKGIKGYSKLRKSELIELLIS